MGNFWNELTRRYSGMDEVTFELCGLTVGPVRRHRGEAANLAGRLETQPTAGPRRHGSTAIHSTAALGGEAVLLGVAALFAGARMFEMGNDTPDKPAASG